MSDFYLPNYHIADSMDLYNRIKKVLGREDLDYWDVHELIAEEWAAFYDEPEKYAGSVVVDMVNKFLDDFVADSYEDTSRYERR